MTDDATPRLVDQGEGPYCTRRWKVFLGDQFIGTIERFFPTWERKPKGLRYVTARGTSKRPEFRPAPVPGQHFAGPGFICAGTTKIRAIEQLLRWHAEGTTADDWHVERIARRKGKS
jgi:hypothetical protein